jgi:hypothetical protein
MPPSQRACLDNRGTDVDADRQGAVIAQRSHQLIRQNGKIVDLEIYFPDWGVQAYAFTFG